MKRKWKTLLTLFLITWVVFSATLFFLNVQRFIGKSYFDSSEFLSNMYEYKLNLEKYVLTPFNAEEAKKKVKVTKEEIEYYRNYYGSLTEQINIIHAQYEDQIEEAENNGRTKVKKLLEKERDEKIADIKKNFESDDYVADKIKKIKYSIIDRYASEYQREKGNFTNLYKYISYNLKNVKTGETFKSGSIESPIYEENFGEKSGYFNAQNCITIYPNELPRNNSNDDDYASRSNEEFLFNELEIEVDEAQFEGTIAIPKSMINESVFKERYEAFYLNKTIFIVISVSCVVALLLLLTIVKPSKKLFLQKSEIYNLFNKLPLDAKLFIMFVIFVIFIYILDTLVNSFGNYEWFYAFLNALFEFFVLFICTTVLTFSIFWTWETVNSEEKFIKEVKESMLFRIGTGLFDLFLYRSIAGLVIVSFITILFLGISFGLFLGYSDGIFVFLISCLGIPIVFIFLQQMGYLNRIMKHTKHMAEGNTTAEIEVKGKFPLSSHASNLNKVREGVEKSMLEQAKSERLKTELITNVSHDLRTPLTSIITYTDLLKNENITEEERKHYIDVIDKKSARLKTLIEDLFEVSKMTSGNIELNKERLDLCQMLHQTIGEHEESFKRENLELRVTIPDESIFAYVDGQKWWRVFDNLIVNALKYSLSGTRVYISLLKQSQQAIFTIKNISSYELTENADELVERFKRADASRNTDGSGLGLAIVQSIVNLHGGNMKIEVDGDLFKVTVTIHTSN